MKLVRLNSISDPFFQKAWELYEDAFPMEERKLLEQQKLMLQNKDYHFDVLIDANKFVGFILWWNFENVRYIDHFAIAVQERNKGIGGLILNEFIGINDKPILLEVELPTSTINQKRIEFYKRLGFKLNQHPYKVPVANQQPLELLLMTYPEQITLTEVETFVNVCHPIIFE